MDSTHISHPCKKPKHTIDLNLANTIDQIIIPIRPTENYAHNLTITPESHLKSSSQISRGKEPLSLDMHPEQSFQFQGLQTPSPVSHNTQVSGKHKKTHKGRKPELFIDNQQTQTQEGSTSKNIIQAFPNLNFTHTYQYEKYQESMGKNDINDNQERSQTTHQDDPSKEDEFFLFDEQDIQENSEINKVRFLGKFLTDKPIHKNSLLMALSSIWCDPEGLKITEIESNILQFSMDKEADAIRIFKGSPWIYINAWLILKEWDGVTSALNIDFESVPVWVQIWRVPPAVRTKAMGTKIGGRLGIVEESEIYQYLGNETLIKIKVVIDTKKPLKPGFFYGESYGTSCLD